VRPVNLVPGDQRTRSAGGKPGSAYVLLGLLAVLLAMATAYVLTTNQVNARNAEVEEMRAEADRLEAQSNNLGAFSAFTQVKQTRQASVSQVAQSRFDWERVMRELALVMPEGSWLQTFEASVSGAPGDTSTTEEDGAGGNPGAQLVGCTRKQTEVAKLMVHLRQMHRVSDVKLNESVREEGEGNGSLEDCGRTYKFDVTVTFGAIPKGEAPRGAQRVPATLGGGQ
jgi:Tfp pilus assembly protein PilN